MAIVIPADYPWHFPIRAREIIESWDAKCKSPYGHSYYDQQDGSISWGFKPLGSHRISDHWNFASNGSKHCCTDVPVKPGAFALGVWDGEKYTILEVIGRRHLNHIPDDEAQGLKPKLQTLRLKRIKDMENYAAHLARIGATA